MVEDDLDPYAVLQVSPTADDVVIRAAYRALARRFHPDLTTSEDARRRMVAINHAWERLCDPTRRSATDRALRDRRSRSRTSAPTPGAGPAASEGPAQAAGEPAWTRGRAADEPERGWGAGAAGPPPGRPAGDVLDFGIYLGWSLGEIARVDRGYLQWLLERPEGRPYRSAIERLLGLPGPTPPPARSGWLRFNRGGR